MTAELPKSVRGAPAELRRLIRKRQNSESAKRCRLRRKLEAAKESGTQLTTAQRMQQLEKCVYQLTQKLVQTQNAVNVLISQRAANLPVPIVQTQVPQTYSSTVHSRSQQIHRYAAQPANLSLPAYHILPSNGNLPTSPATPTSCTYSKLQVPDIVPESPRSQNTISDTDSTILAAQELEAENLPSVSEPVDVGSPFSDNDFMNSVVPTTNFTDDMIFFGEFGVVSSDTNV